MNLFLITLLCACATAEYSPFFSQPKSAASEAQIKFAIENKYDDTGPGAKQRETAYRTYSKLDDALLSYINDKDTKLPEYENSIALNKLLKSNKYYTKVVHEVPKQDIGKGLGLRIGDNFLRSGPVDFGFDNRASLSRPGVTPRPLYSLVYDVNDKQSFPAGPSAQGDFLRGYYSLKDGQGQTRVIQYSVNHNGGYSALERRSDVTKFI